MHLARPTTPIGPAASNGHDGVAGESAGAAFTGVSCKALLLVLFEAELYKKRMSCTALLNCLLSCLLCLAVQENLCKKEEGTVSKLCIKLCAELCICEYSSETIACFLFIKL